MLYYDLKILMRYIRMYVLLYLRKSSGFNNFAFGLVGTRISITGINDRVAIFAIKTGGAKTFIISVGQRPARGSVHAGIVVTKVAFCQHIRAYRA